MQILAVRYTPTSNQLTAIVDGPHGRAAVDLQWESKSPGVPVSWRESVLAAYNERGLPAYSSPR